MLALTLDRWPSRDRFAEQAHSLPTACRRRRTSGAAGHRALPAGHRCVATAAEQRFSGCHRVADTSLVVAGARPGPAGGKCSASSGTDGRDTRMRHGDRSAIEEARCPRGSFVSPATQAPDRRARTRHALAELAPVGAGVDPPDLLPLVGGTGPGEPTAPAHRLQKGRHPRSVSPPPA
jgi:hypothetical protein